MALGTSGRTFFCVVFKAKSWIGVRVEARLFRRGFTLGLVTVRFRDQVSVRVRVKVRVRVRVKDKA